MVNSSRPHLDPILQPPTGLPALAAGAHVAPEDGTCLMEYASVLAGEPFSDHPRCTDPMLATLARLVNDATTDGGRHRLGTMAPALAARPHTDAVGSAALVLGTLWRAQEATGQPDALKRHARRAQRRLRRVSHAGFTGRWARLLEPAHRHGSGRRSLIAAVDATAQLSEDERDALLRDMLSDALAIRPPTLPARREQLLT